MPGAIGLVLRNETREVEYAHQHPPYDGSIHAVLNPDVADDVIDAGWGERHPWAGTRLPVGYMLIFGPRDEGEVEVVVSIVRRSYEIASG